MLLHVCIQYAYITCMFVLCCMYLYFMYVCILHECVKFYIFLSALYAFICIASLCIYCHVFVDINNMYFWVFYVSVYVLCVCWYVFCICIYCMYVYIIPYVCIYIHEYCMFVSTFLFYIWTIVDLPHHFCGFTPPPKSTHNNWKSAFRASIFELLHFFFVFGGFRRKLDIFGSGGRRENLIRVRGYPHFFDLWVRGTPTFFTEKSSFRRPYPINHSKTPKFVKFTKKWKKNPKLRRETQIFSYYGSIWVGVGVKSPIWKYLKNWTSFTGKTAKKS